MKVSLILMSMVAAVGFLTPLTGCGKKEKKIYVEKESENPTPNNPNVGGNGDGNGNGNQNPVADNPIVKIKNKSNLAQQVTADGKITIEFTLTGASYNDYVLLCAGDKFSDYQIEDARPCETQGSHTMTGLVAGERYAFGIVAVHNKDQNRMVKDETSFEVSTGDLIQISNLDTLQTQNTGPINLTLSMKNGQQVTFKCAIGNQQIDCTNGQLNFYMDTYPGNRQIDIKAYDPQSGQVVANKIVPFCANGGQQPCANANPGPGGPGPGPGPGGVGGGPIPIPVPSAPVFLANLGNFWDVFVPPGFHVINYSTSETWVGSGVVETIDVLNDPTAPSFFCLPGLNTARIDNGAIISLDGADGFQYTYCKRYHFDEAAFKEATGFKRAKNSVEFATSPYNMVQYKRIAFNAFNDPETMFSVSRFEALCKRNFNAGENEMNIINNFWNGPIPRPVEVKWCQTRTTGIIGPVDVWVAGFFFTDVVDGEETIALEGLYIATPGTLGFSFNPANFLGMAGADILTVLRNSGFGQVH